MGFHMPMIEKATLGLIQMSCSGDPERNLAKAVERIREAAARGAQIVCLQELFRSLYFCQEENAELFDLAEPIPGPSTKALSTVAAELGVVIVGSLFEKRAPGVYHNTAVVFDADGAMLGIYRKMHIPDDPLYYEKFYFTPGDLGFKTFDTRFGRIAPLVCWDQWYPEAARLASLRGAQLLVYPTAIGWHPAEKEQYGRASARSLEDHPAFARHRQRPVRGGGEPRRTRAPARKLGFEAGRLPGNRVFWRVVRMRGRSFFCHLTHPNRAPKCHLIIQITINFGRISSKQTRKSHLKKKRGLEYPYSYFIPLRPIKNAASEPRLAWGRNIATLNLFRGRTKLFYTIGFVNAVVTVLIGTKPRVIVTHHFYVTILRKGI